MKTFREFLNNVSEAKVATITLDYDRANSKFSKAMEFLHNQKNIEFEITTDTVKLKGDSNEIRKFLKIQLGMTDGGIKSVFPELK